MKNLILKAAKYIKGPNGSILIVNPDGSINVAFVQNPYPVWDEHSVGFVDLNNATFTEIFKYETEVGEQVFINDINLSLKGWSGHFKITINDGSTDDIIRECVVNVQMPSHPIHFEKAREVSGVGSHVRVEAILHGAGQNGSGFVGMNGYKIVTP